MRYLFLVLILTFLSPCAHAQWQQLQTSVLEQADVRGAVATDSAFYIGTPSGVYRSVDDGFTWQHSFRINGKENYCEIRRLLKCGNGVVAFSDSLLYVTNGGTNWNILNLPFKADYILQSVNKRLLCLGYNSNSIRELYFSDDMGSHWVKSINAINTKINYSTLLFPNTAQDLIFLTYNDTIGSQVKEKLVASRDGEHFFPMLDSQALSLGINYMDGDSGHVYAAFNDKPCVFNTVLAQWDTLSSPDINRQGLKDTEVTLQAQFFYHGALFIGYVKTRFVYDGGTFKYVYVPVLFKTVDNGKHWQKLSTVFFGNNYILKVAFKNADKFIIYNGPQYSNDAGIEDESKSNFRIMLDSGKTATYSNRGLYTISAGISQIDTQLLVLRSTFSNVFKIGNDFGLSKMYTGMDSTDLYGLYPSFYVNGRDNAMILSRYYNQNEVEKFSSDWGKTWNDFSYPSNDKGYIFFVTIAGKMYTCVCGSKIHSSEDFGKSWIDITTKLPAYSYITHIDQSDSIVNVLCQTTSGKLHDNHILYHTKDLSSFVQIGQALKLSNANLSHIGSVPVVTGSDSADFSNIYYLKDSMWVKAKMQGISEYDRNHILGASVQCLGDIVYASSPGSAYYSTDLGEHFEKIDDLPDGLSYQYFAMHDSVLFMRSNAGIWYNKSLLKEHRLTSLSGKGPTTVYGGAMKVYPNPTHNSVNVQLNLQQRGQIQLQLMSMDGRVLFTQSNTANTGNTVIPISLNGLSPGIYLLRMNTEKEQYNTKIVVN